MQPQPLTQQLTANQVKAQLCNYFRESYISEFPLKYNSGITILTDDCKPSREVQLGFCGRVLLNAFNEVEWGEAPHIQLIGTSGPDSEGEAFEHGWIAMTELTADLVDEHLLPCLLT
jgi:hypothetical protein